MAVILNHEDTVAKVRAKYGTLPTPDECVAICNEVAWIHRDEGFGIGEKTSGTHGVRYDGQKCTIDGLVFRHPDHAHGDQFIDILGNADGRPPRAVPQWSVKESSNRPWVKPIRPQGEPVPEPEPEPEPPADSFVTQAQFLAYKKSVDQRFAALSAEIQGLRDEMLRAVAGLQSQIAELDARFGRLRARGRTGTTTFHSHQADLPVEIV